MSSSGAVLPHSMSELAPLPNSAHVGLARTLSLHQPPLPSPLSCLPSSVAKELQRFFFHREPSANPATEDLCYALADRKHSHSHFPEAALLGILDLTMPAQLTMTKASRVNTIAVTTGSQAESTSSSHGAANAMPASKSGLFNGSLGGGAANSSSSDSACAKGADEGDGPVVSVVDYTSSFPSGLLPVSQELAKEMKKPVGQQVSPMEEDEGKKEEEEEEEEINGQREVFLNTHEPFCLAAVGVQGAGKSHTLACVLEACLIPFPEADVVRLQHPMSAMVLHYDQSILSICEATGLICSLPRISEILSRAAEASCNVSTPGFCDMIATPAAPKCCSGYSGNNTAGAAATVSSSLPFQTRLAVPHLPKEKMVVLVSPSYYHQRKAFYGSYCTVRPLLFRWHTLTADLIKRILRIKEGESQLYDSSILNLLRNFQRHGITFPVFIKQARDCSSLRTQVGSLAPRLKLLEKYIAESEENADILADSVDLLSTIKPGVLVVVDLTDPLVTPEEANGIFQVLTEQYRAAHIRGGKILALDEAHKFMDGVKSDGLSDAIVNVVRRARHNGMRLVISSQSPRSLAPELLELVTVAVLHRFHSYDWFSYLSQKLPLCADDWERLMFLQPGHALVFASRYLVPLMNQHRRAAQERTVGDGRDHDDQLHEGRASCRQLPLMQTYLLPIHIRPRITADRGGSRLNQW